MVVQNGEIEEPEVIESEPILEPGGETETEAIDTLLLRGLSLGQVVNKGFARSTVRQRIKKLTKQGKLNNDKLPVKSDTTFTVSEKARIIPETLEREFESIFDGNERDRKIFMAGASLPLLGMRLFGESYKPILELLKANQQAQLDMAKANQNSSENVAAETVNQLMPQILASMEKQATIKQKVDIASVPNPMQGIMARQMERMMDRIMSATMPGTGVQGAVTNAPPLPAGWQDLRI